MYEDAKIREVAWALRMKVREKAFPEFHGDWRDRWFEGTGNYPEFDRATFGGEAVSDDS